MKTYVPNAAAIDTANKKWYIIDAEGKTLGRLATEVARNSDRQTQTHVYAELRYGRFCDRNQCRKGCRDR